MMGISDIIAAIGGTAAALMTVIKIAPINIDPWKKLGEMIGRGINGEALEKIDRVGQKVDRLEMEIAKVKAEDERREAEARRVRILRFGDEILKGVMHTKEHFDQTLLDVTAYENYCRRHPEFANEVTESTVEHIRDTYRQCRRDKSFL